ncbi:hypothetical protein [Bacillus thuringiensis]|uniref:hypothetical protein n=1 Tax=Bacillus thuringiensis TaxID=1428 RepID=UPI000A3A867E|nr:hypothetical protein [Bacillus thuringiensis]OUA82765.1 hypothetical protein BK706_31210 [Bacillus thuringiensis serovar leesis]OUA92393.1 hypothetical protein BK706_10420 [Bacillus thuringiensis serovar leesis]OUA92405.1 hypothetical protein BK706_10360 [Bacillus thuringiensis serovar leesis]
MEPQKTCECNRCKRYNVYRKWKVKQGDPIKVYSFGHLLKKWGTFLNMDYSFIRWLDEEQNTHFTSLRSLQIQKIM